MNHNEQNIQDPLEHIIEKTWHLVPPFWPLSHLIAVNPLQSLEEEPFEEAVDRAQSLFEQKELPNLIRSLNRNNIKWMQSFFDRGQATFPMPLKHLGFYRSWRKLAAYDGTLHGHSAEKKAWIAALPEDAPTAIRHALSALGLLDPDHEKLIGAVILGFLGWSSYVKYLHREETTHGHAGHLLHDYLAVRLATLFLLHSKTCSVPDFPKRDVLIKKRSIAAIQDLERTYLADLLPKIRRKAPAQERPKPEAQFVFCIDVRSEPFRRTIEKHAAYETLGCAGFFGAPVAIRDAYGQHNACPAIITPDHQVGAQSPQPSSLFSWIKKAHHALKYNLTTPFVLPDLLFPFLTPWVFLSVLFPVHSHHLKERFSPKKLPVIRSVDTLPLDTQCTYAFQFLSLMGWVDGFAPLVVLCGHGSTTTNNPFASSLDCGACGGHAGGNNAQIMAMILNQPVVRAFLQQQGITVPETTCFVAAEHDTTTDEVFFFEKGCSEIVLERLRALRQDLMQTGADNAAFREQHLKRYAHAPLINAKKRSVDIAQVRPEWGLARNASLIIGPRWMTSHQSLEGRSFLHSYEPSLDPEGTQLHTIMTGPMIVAQWINAQYFFSTLNNVSYGAGNKITANLVGQFGVMQGNASDLMSGLPIQSVWRDDRTPYHETLRLVVLIHAPPERIHPIIAQDPGLQRLIRNAWVHLICLPVGGDEEPLWLNPELTWCPSTLFFQDT